MNIGKQEPGRVTEPDENPVPPKEEPEREPVETPARKGRWDTATDDDPFRVQVNR